MAGANQLYDALNLKVVIIPSFNWLSDIQQECKASCMQGVCVGGGDRYSCFPKLKNNIASCIDPIDFN